jgi:hypothetical protein
MEFDAAHLRAARDGTTAGGDTAAEGGAPRRPHFHFHTDTHASSIWKFTTVGSRLTATVKSRVAGTFRVFIVRCGRPSVVRPVGPVLRRALTAVRRGVVTGIVWMQFTRTQHLRVCGQWAVAAVCMCHSNLQAVTRQCV